MIFRPTTGAPDDVATCPVTVTFPPTGTRPDATEIVIDPGTTGRGLDVRGGGVGVGRGAGVVAIGVGVPRGRVAAVW
jgi:hypothetical protein